MPSDSTYNDSTLLNRQQTLNMNEYEHIVVIGVGGIGSWVALNVALAGISRRIDLYDPDEVECSNLNRTPFRVCDISRKKVLAMKFLILERRPHTTIAIFPRKFTAKDSCNYYSNLDLFIDCRDDVYDDLKNHRAKVYKLGYDGTSITIDGNPKETKVWGQSQGYSVVPSFVCPSQLAANLIVNHISLKNDGIFEEMPSYLDKLGLFNEILTFDSGDLLTTLHEEYNLSGANSEETRKDLKKEVEKISEASKPNECDCCDEEDFDI